MRQNKIHFKRVTFSFPEALLVQLKTAIGDGNRSQYVAEAVAARLKGDQGAAENLPEWFTKFWQDLELIK